MAFFSAQKELKLEHAREQEARKAKQEKHGKKTVPEFISQAEAQAQNDAETAAQSSVGQVQTAEEPKIMLPPDNRRARRYYAKVMPREKAIEKGAIHREYDAEQRALAAEAQNSIAKARRQ